eukprot:scaffold77077_cov63-Attheya_sp.AAC.1
MSTAPSEPPFLSPLSLLAEITRGVSTITLALIRGACYLLEKYDTLCHRFGSYCLEARLYFLSYRQWREYHTADIIKAVQDISIANQQSPVYAVTSQHTGAAQAIRAHVPPVVTHMQKEYVKPHKIKSRRRCTWAPYCEHTIDVCGGSNKRKCKDHHMHNNNNTDEELKQAKQRM